MECFRHFGIFPFCREPFIMIVVTGASSSMRFFKRDVGMGSRLHDLLGDLLIIDRTSSSSRSLKIDSVDSTTFSSKPKASVEVSLNSLRILSIFFYDELKNC